MPRPHLVIFDCDGVLVDSEPISLDVLLETVAQAGLDLSVEDANRQFLGRSMASVVKMLNDKHGVRLDPVSLDAMRQRLYAKFRNELEPIKGIADAVERLPMPYCVASSSQVERIELSLDVTGLLPKFAGHIFSSSMVKHGKPAPDLFLHAAHVMGVDPSRCVVVEDSPAGVIAAKAAGMRVLAFTGGGHAGGADHRETLAALGPDAIFEDMRELPGLIGLEKQNLHRADDHKLVVAVDVGTGSARAGVFTGDGRMLARREKPILMNRTDADFAEHDSEDIWSAVCGAVRGAMEAAGAEPEAVKGISFDATCSLVLRGKQGEQLSVARNGEARWDTLVWLDHRALKEADECTATGHAVLDHVGGVMSPEMQVPKLMWLKRHLPQTWRQMGLAFDLADFLSWKASGSTARSQCTLTCKWTYLAHEDQPWRADFLQSVGLEDLLETAGLPASASLPGSDLGALTVEAAAALGLTVACRVGAGLIDAYAGALGVLGAYADDADALESHLALVAGTSSCVMTFAKTLCFVPGFWGPYKGVVFPDLWMFEGGQSATGGLLDHAIRVHSAGGEPTAERHMEIIKRIGELRAEHGEALARRLHVLPDFHGNRSPLADPHALGVLSGLTIDASFDGLCRIYWRTAVSIALGIRHILEALADKGLKISTLSVTGGHLNNPLLTELYADATGCTMVVPASEDATLLGTAMVAAVAAGIHADLASAGSAMHRAGRARKPDPKAARRFDVDYEAFKMMHRHRQELDALTMH